MANQDTTNKRKTASDLILETLAGRTEIKDGFTAGELADHTGKSPVTIARYVRYLMADGLVKCWHVAKSARVYTEIPRERLLSDMTPVEVDTLMCDELTKMDAARRTLQSLFAVAQYRELSRFDELYRNLAGLTQYRSNDLYADEVEYADEATEYAYRPWKLAAKELAAAQNKADEAYRIIAAGKKVVDTCNDEWERRGNWSRYHIVQGGHVHAATFGGVTCGSIRWSNSWGYTRHFFVPAYSGMDANTLIAKIDSTACTRCFPDAPVAGKRIGPKPGQCKHSGEVIAEPMDKWAHYNRYHKCECGSHVNVTTTGKLRAHKPAAAEFAVN